MGPLLELTHALSTLAMVAIIWFVQIVHYPLFEQVGEASFAAYEKAHVLRITWVVGPAMLLEMATAFSLVVSGGRFLSPAELWFGLGLLAVVWASTLFIQVPLHARLGEAFDLGVAQRLVASNWIRTIAWTGRGGLVVMGLWRGMS